MSVIHLSHPRRSLLVALIVFLLAGVAATTMIWQGEQHNRQEQRLRVANLADDHMDALQRYIEHTLSATYALAALVRQGNGTVPAFERIASGMLPLYSGGGVLCLRARRRFDR